MEDAKKSNELRLACSNPKCDFETDIHPAKNEAGASLVRCPKCSGTDFILVSEKKATPKPTSFAPLAK